MGRLVFSTDWSFLYALAGPYWSTFPSLRLLLRPMPPSSSSSSTWRLGHEAGGGGDEQPLLCEAALYSAAHQVGGYMCVRVRGTYIWLCTAVAQRPFVSHFPYTHNTSTPTHTPTQGRPAPRAARQRPRRREQARLLHGDGGRRRRPPHARDPPTTANHHHHHQQQQRHEQQ